MATEDGVAEAGAAGKAAAGYTMGSATKSTTPSAQHIAAITLIGHKTYSQNGHVMGAKR